MTIALIGSVAINLHVPGFRAKPADLDLMMSYEDFISWVGPRQAAPVCGGEKFICRDSVGITEVEIAAPGSAADAFLQMAKSTGRSYGGYWIPSLDMLFALKASHRYLKNSPHFTKTIEDYHRLRSMGCRVHDSAWLRQREAETYTYAHPKLNKSKSEFFSGDGVEYIYDHDSIHLAVMVGERPAYTYFKPNDRDVLTSRSVFCAQPYDVQINSVLEEALVLAIERSQVPFPGILTPYQSFMLALSKVCTSITSGWWREFAYDNYYVVLGRYRDDYMERFNKALSSGVVRSSVPA